MRRPLEQSLSQTDHRFGAGVKHKQIEIVSRMRQTVDMLSIKFRDRWSPFIFTTCSSEVICASKYVTARCQPADRRVGNPQPGGSQRRRLLVRKTPSEKLTRKTKPSAAWGAGGRASEL
jgi:hypothetical protein